MTLLRILGIDRYTAKFKEWIRSKFIAKGGLKTINNESIEGKGNIEVQANAEMVLPESVGLTNIETTNESRVIRAFYNIQNDEFTIRGLNDEIQPLRFWILNKAIFLGQILNITIVNGDVRMYHCVAKINLFTATVQFDYLDTHYTLTWNADTQSWDVTKTPINTGADWNAQEGEVGYIKNRTHYLDCESYTSIDVESEDDYDTGMMRHTYRFVASPSSDETKVAVKVEIYNPTDGADDYIKYIILNTNDHISGEGDDIISFKVGFTEFYGMQDGDEITLWTLIGYSDVIPNLSFAYIYDRQYKQLDEVFISSDIARKSDVEKVDFYLGEVGAQAAGALAEVIKHEEQLTELSAEIGKKQDTISDLETIRSGAAKGATAIQEVKTINGQSIVGSGNIEIQGGGGGGASSDKQGVVSQTLNYNSADNTYSVSNVVRGSIPSFFIDLVTEAGASFNAESGYFSLNGIDNIAYDEMRQIYDCRTGYGTNSLLSVYGNTYTARTNFVAFRGYETSYGNHEPTTIYTKYLCSKNASITKFALCGALLYVRTGSGNNFDSLGSGVDVVYRSRLEEIIGVLDVANLTGSNNFFYNGAWHPWLTTFQLKELKASIDLSGMPRLSEATILYMINNEKATAAITIKLHADAKAMADASEAIQSALANHANITLGV